MHLCTRGGTRTRKRYPPGDFKRRDLSDFAAIADDVVAQRIDRASHGNHVVDDDVVAPRLYRSVEFGLADQPLSQNQSIAV